MYFETIHDLSEFEEICGPEDGYSSCWETETEFDSELGNFIFHNVTGDSASVICIDEAMDLLEMREQRQQVQQQMQQQMEEARRKGLSDNIGDDLAKLGPGDLEEYTFDQQSDGKRSGGASRHSHHSGSDGTYDGPQQASIHTTHIVSSPPNKPDHIYETLDTCQDHHFQVYISKGSADSQHSTAKVHGHVTDNDSDKTSTVRKEPTATKSSTSKSTFSKTRAQSFEQATAVPKREKLNLKKKMSLDSHERGVQVAPKQFPAPIKGYGAEKPTLSSSPSKRSSQEKINSSSPLSSSPSKRSSQEKINFSSPTGTSSSHNSVPPSLIIKHKGKTYFIPVVEKKREGKSKQTSSSSKRVHNVLCTTASPSRRPDALPPSLPMTVSTSFASGHSSNETLKNLTSPVAEHFDGLSTNRRRKVYQQNGSIAPSKHSAASNKVTHYGML